MCRLQVVTLGYLILMQILRKHVARLPLEKGVVNELVSSRTKKIYVPETSEQPAKTVRACLCAKSNYFSQVMFSVEVQVADGSANAHIGQPARGHY